MLKISRQSIDNDYKLMLNREYFPYILKSEMRPNLKPNKSLS
jgi:hypothetical protein